MANLRISSLRPGDKIALNDVPSVEMFIGFSDHTSKYGKNPGKIFDTFKDLKNCIYHVSA